MKLYALSVRDRAADVFGSPFFSPSVGLAVRQFGDQVANPEPNNMLNKHPEDFDLYQVGLFDDQTGGFEPQLPQMVAIGKDYAKTTH